MSLRRVLANKPTNVSDVAGLPTRRNRIEAAAEALTFLRGVVADSSAELPMRIRAACFLVDQAKYESGWNRREHSFDDDGDLHAFMATDEPPR